MALHFIATEWVKMHGEEEPDCTVTGHPWSCGKIVAMQMASRVSLPEEAEAEGGDAVIELLLRQLEQAEREASRA
jgi:hypothetical protein